MGTVDDLKQEYDSLFEREVKLNLEKNLLIR